VKVRTAPATREPLGGRWVTCRRCDADDPVQVLRSGDRLLGIPGRFQVVRCRRCGFLYTNPQPRDPDLGRHYPDAYYVPPGPESDGAGPPRGGIRARLRAGVLRARGYPQPSPGPGRAWLAAGRVAGLLLGQRFLWLPPFVPGGTVLDVGCGSGAHLAELRDLGWNTVGVEMSDTAALAARERLGLDVRTGTLEDAAIPRGYADVVLLRMVLEHVRDPRRTLAEARRILRPGGRIIVSVPNAGSIETRFFGPYWFAWDLPRHLSHFTPGSLTAMLREAGFGRIRVRHLVNANNLSGSIRYRGGGTGTLPGGALKVLAALQAAAKTAGRISAEAVALPPANGDGRGRR
jgi:SAM-dependent methyltransferase